MVVNFEGWQFPAGDELVVARQDIKGLFLLNSSARLLWERWMAGTALEDIVEDFVLLFGVSRERAKADIEATLSGWSETLLSPVRSAATDAARFDPARLNRAATVVVECVLNGHGFRILLEPGDLVDEIVPRLAHAIVPALPPGAPVSTFLLATGEETVFVLRDGACIAEEPKISGARVILLQEMTRLCSPGRDLTAILHAGACGNDLGCVVLAGASHAGKSTLCAALMTEGLACLSDDSAIIDHECNVAGMPFPLMLRKSSWPVLAARSSRIDRASVRQRWGEEVRFLPGNLLANTSPSVPAKALVFVDYRPESRVCLQPLTTFESLLELQKGGFWVEHNRESIARFVGWVDGLERYKLTYSAIDEGIEAVTAFLQTESVLA